jgi:hypothetical protein
MLENHFHEEEKHCCFNINTILISLEKFFWVMDFNGKVALMTGEIFFLINEKLLKFVGML